MQSAFYTEVTADLFNSKMGKNEFGGIEVRMYALLKEHVDNVRKLMIYDSENDGVYVFLYDTQEDESGFADLWFETFDEAVDYCIEEYKVIEDQWVVVKDPKEGQQHDIIN